MEAWQATAGAALDADTIKRRISAEALPAAFYVLITCRDERQQVELPGRFNGEGVDCKAVLA